MPIALVLLIQGRNYIFPIIERRIREYVTQTCLLVRISPPHL
jgi:hypothetical protein